MVLNERLVRIEYKTYSRTKRERERQRKREREIQDSCTFGSTPILRMLCGYTHYGFASFFFLVFFFDVVPFAFYRFVMRLSIFSPHL